MKVIHLVTSLNVGGAERFVLDLSRAQVSVGKEVSIFAMGTANDELIAKGACDGLNVRIIDKRSPFGLISFVISLLCCDVIHIHSPYAYKALFPLLKRLASGKIVYTRHGAGRFDSEEWQQFHFNAQKHLRALAFVSSEAKTVFEEVNPRITVNGQVIDNGVIVPTASQLDGNSKQNSISIGSVGRMVELKYQRHLIEAVAKLGENVRNKLSVHFFGDGEDREMLEALAVSLNVTNAVTFHGIVSDRQQIYGNLDFLCVTSETEGLSLAIIEAMSFGVPAIATNVGGNPTLVRPNQTGWLYEFGDLPHLAQLLEELIENRHKAKAMGESARELIMNNYSINNSERKYEELYTE